MSATAVHDGSAVTMDVLLELLELDVDGTLLKNVELDVDGALLEEVELDVDGALLTKLFDVELEDVPLVEETPLVVLLELVEPLDLFELGLVTVFELASEIELEWIPSVEMLDAVEGVVTDTVTRAYR